MFARVTLHEGLPDHMEAATATLHDEILPQLQQCEGFKGFISLVDRAGGRVLSTSLWESEVARKASVHTAADLRRQAVAADQLAFLTFLAVDDYEVGIFDLRPSRPSTE
jgi:heme-degrading monooxygenase HmoA